jgi:hypothetical protein
MGLTDTYLFNITVVVGPCGTVVTCRSNKVALKSDLKEVWIQVRYSRSKNTLPFKRYVRHYR